MWAPLCTWCTSAAGCSYISTFTPCCLKLVLKQNVKPLTVTMMRASMLVASLNLIEYVAPARKLARCFVPPNWLLILLSMLF